MSSPSGKARKHGRTVFWEYRDEQQATQKLLDNIRKKNRDKVRVRLDFSPPSSPDKVVRSQPQSKSKRAAAYDTKTPCNDQGKGARWNKKAQGYNCVKKRNTATLGQTMSQTYYGMTLYRGKNTKSGGAIYYLKDGKRRYLSQSQKKRYTQTQ